MDGTPSCKTTAIIRSANATENRAPPGARYDPVGPNDGPPNLRGGPPFPGRGGPRGGGVGGGFGSGHPSNPFDGYGRNDFM